MRSGNSGNVSDVQLRGITAPELRSRRWASPLLASTLFRLAWALLLLAVVGAWRLDAQDAPADALRTDLLQTGLFLVHGGGTNSVLRLSAQGVIVVDSKSPGNFQAFMKQIRRIVDLPVAVVINTGYEPAQTGNNADFHSAQAEILAHRNVKEKLIQAGAQASDPALPSRLYESEFLLRLGGVNVRVIHPGLAHTAGDSVVYFEDSRLIAVGNLLSASAGPDYAAGGSFVGWAHALSDILKLNFDTVVASQGNAVGRTELVALQSRMDAVIEHGAKLLNSGVRKDMLIELLAQEVPDLRLNFSQDQVDHLCRELSGLGTPNDSRTRAFRDSCE